MKLFFSLVSFLFSLAAFGGTCSLDKPIDLVGGKLTDEMHLYNVVLDEQPQFETRSDVKWNYDPNVDDLKIVISAVRLDHQKTNNFIFGIKASNKTLSVGPVSGYGNFSPGDLIVKNTDRIEAGITYYETEIRMHMDNPINHTEDYDLNKTSIGVLDGKIVSLNITYSVLKTIEKNSELVRLYYAGEERTICVKSAELTTNGEY